MLAAMPGDEVAHDIFGENRPAVLVLASDRVRDQGNKGERKEIKRRNTGQDHKRVSKMISNHTIYRGDGGRSPRRDDR